MQVIPFLKTTGKIIAAFLLCFFLTASLISVFYEKEIKQLIIAEINNNINTKITVGEFDFTVLRHFPNASFELKDVVIDGVSENNTRDTLLFSKRLSLLFNIKDIFSKDINIKKVYVYDGGLNIRIDKQGHGNYIFWKKSADSTQSGVVDIHKIGLKNVYLNYADKKSDQEYAMLAKHVELSGKFASNKFSFTTEANLFVDRLIVHGENYVNHKPVVLQSGLDVDSKLGTYLISESKIKIAGVAFSANGQISEKNDDWFLDLIVKSSQSDFATLNTIIPSSLNFSSAKFKSGGAVTFNASIKGQVSDNKKPSIAIDFKVKDGRFSSEDASFEKITFSGTFSNSPEKKSNILTIPDLSASLSGHVIQANIKIENFPDAFITLEAKTQLDLGKLMPFFKADTLESLSGDLAMNIAYAGKIKELKNISKDRFFDVKASGNIDISHVYLKLKKNPLEFRDLNGSFSLHDRDVFIENFSGNVSSTDFRLKGIFRNFISFLLIPGESGDMQAQLISNSVNLDELLVNKKESASGDTSYIMKFNPRLLCELDVKIENLHFRRFTAENITGKVNLDHQVIHGSALHFNSMAGNVDLDATINASRRDSIYMVYETKFEKVDITRLFYEMENFDQQILTDKNVKGKVSADFQFHSMWSNDLTLNSKSVRSTGSIVVESGELNNFLPIQALAKYIHVPDLNHIRFSTLKNNISIANRKISVPNMDINSSAINISGNGTHDFDNNVDYHIALLLSDVLGKKVDHNSSEFGEIADDGLGRTKLFLNMKGSVTDPHFSYDKKAAGEKIRNEVAMEKANIKGILKQEFGLFKHEASVQAPKPKKTEEMQIDWSEK